MTRYRAQQAFTDGGYFIWVARIREIDSNWLKYGDLPKQYHGATLKRTRAAVEIDSVEFPTMAACRQVARQLNARVRASARARDARARRRAEFEANRQ